MKKKGPKLTVIMPSLNVVTYIDECLSSVQNQTLNDIEIICVDAGSTDGTLEYLAEKAKNDERIKLLRSNKKSYGYQINIGIQNACGEYIGVVETDDYVDKNMFHDLYCIAKEFDVDFVKADFNGYINTEKNKRLYYTSKLGSKNLEIYNKLLNPSEMEFLYINDVNIWKGIYKKSFLIDHNICLNETDGAAFQDIGFAHQVLACATKAYYSDKSYYRYCMDRDESSSFSEKGLQFVMQEYKWLIENNIYCGKDVCHIGFFSRMLDSFVGELDKTLISLGFDIKSEYIRTPYEWISKLVVDKNLLSLLNHDREDDKFSLIINNLEKYSKLLQKEYLKGQRERENLIACIRNKEVVIWGTGKYGMLALKLCCDNGCHIRAMTDNNLLLWNTKFNGYKIVQPKELVKLDDEVLFVVANKYYAGEIMQQIRELGVSEEKIKRYV